MYSILWLTKLFKKKINNRWYSLNTYHMLWCGDVIHLILSASQWRVYSLFNTLLSNLILLGIWSTDCLDPLSQTDTRESLCILWNTVPSFWNSTLVIWCWLADGMRAVTWIHNHIIFQFLYLTRVIEEADRPTVL